MTAPAGGEEGDPDLACMALSFSNNAANATLHRPFGAEADAAGCSM